MNNEKKDPVNLVDLCEFLEQETVLKSDHSDAPIITQSKYSLRGGLVVDGFNSDKDLLEKFDSKEKITVKYISKTLRAKVVTDSASVFGKNEANSFITDEDGDRTYIIIAEEYTESFSGIIVSLEKNWANRYTQDTQIAKITLAGGNNHPPYNDPTFQSFVLGSSGWFIEDNEGIE